MDLIRGGSFQVIRMEEYGLEGEFEIFSPRCGQRLGPAGGKMLLAEMGQRRNVGGSRASAKRAVFSGKGNPVLLICIRGQNPCGGLHLSAQSVRPSQVLFLSAACQ